MQIDLVVPYVDATDKNWQQIFIKEKAQFYNSTEAIAVNRFRSMGSFFRYFFRSVEKNMPWLHNVFLLVQSKSQVPSWIDTTKVKIITHDQFIPKQFLPTFNSGTIEMFLQNIPGLSEHFIYTNDDIFALRPMKETDFFIENTCVFNYLADSDSTKNEWRQMCQNNHDLIFGTNKAVPYLRLDHEFRPYLKSKMIECYNKYKQQIFNSISMFRLPKNLTIFLFSLYLLKNKLQQKTTLQIGYLCSTSSRQDINKKLSTADSVCLNDTSTTINLYDKLEVRATFYSKFNEKSKYELNDDQNLKCEIKSKADSRADGKTNAYLYF